MLITDDQVQELRQKMQSQRALLIETAAGLTAAEAKQGRPEREGEEGWSPLQQLSHLWEMELMYRSWIVAALTQERPDVGKMPMLLPPITVERANEHTVDELLAGLASQRAMTESVVDGLHLEQYGRTALHPVFGELNVLQWLRSFYRHDRMHRVQMSGEEPDYQPRGDGAGMDQRRMRLRLGEERLKAVKTMDELLAAAAQSDQ